MSDWIDTKQPWPKNYHQPHFQHVLWMQVRARELAQEARAMGLVLTIEQVQTEPRVGAHCDKITISPRRVGAKR